MDAVSELILSDAGVLVGPVAVLDDQDGALTSAARATGTETRAHCDDVRDEARLPPGTRSATPAAAVAGARTVLWRLPRSLDAVEETAELIAHLADRDVRLVAGARIKDLTRRMNDVLGRSFGHVSASLGVRKARVLRAGHPRPSRPSWPRTAEISPWGLWVVAHGATFNTYRLDAGTGLLLRQFDRLPPPARALDLGCGSGILAAALARRGWTVVAVDVSWTACDATELTAAANGLTLRVVRADGPSGLPGGSQDLIVCNPPFHRGPAKDTTPTRLLFTQARTALRSGGEFWTVFNTHLPYLAWLRESIGPTSIAVRDRHYTVTRSVRP